MKKIVLSLVALGCLSMASFAHGFTGATPAGLDPQINTNFRYAVAKSAQEASATRVEYTLTDAEMNAMGRARNKDIYFRVRFKNETKFHSQAVVGRLYKYKGVYKIYITRTDWEHAYDEVMPGWTTRHLGRVAEQKIEVGGKIFRLDDPNTLWPHEHIANKITIVTLGKPSRK